uniref:Uncharacterized protein n=1 Tax=viral metagenome TaxID=1070528 RepID=A0A6M3KEJ7_9ZZZZ
MKDVSTYFTHDELCEMLDVPKESGLFAPDYSLIWWPPAEMWKLTMKVGTLEEIESLIN